MKILIMNLYWSIQIQILQFKGFVMHESKLNDCDYFLSTTPKYKRNLTLCFICNNQRAKGGSEAYTV